MTDDDDKEDYRCVFTEEELKPMTDDDDKEDYRCVFYRRRTQTDD